MRERSTVYDGSCLLERDPCLTLEHAENQRLSQLQSEFLRFVFSRQGEPLVAESGYVPLTFEPTTTELARLGLPD